MSLMEEDLKGGSVVLLEDLEVWLDSQVRLRVVGRKEGSVAEWDSELLLNHLGSEEKLQRKKVEIFASPISH